MGLSQSTLNQRRYVFTSACVARPSLCFSIDILHSIALNASHELFIYCFYLTQTQLTTMKVKQRKPVQHKDKKVSSKDIINSTVRAHGKEHTTRDQLTHQQNNRKQENDQQITTRGQSVHQQVRKTIRKPLIDVVENNISPLTPLKIFSFFILNFENPIIIVIIIIISLYY